MTVKLLTEQHLEFLSLKGGWAGLSESTLVKMPHCWKSHVTAHIESRSCDNGTYSTGIQSQETYENGPLSLARQWSGPIVARDSTLARLTVNCLRSYHIYKNINVFYTKFSGSWTAIHLGAATYTCVNLHLLYSVGLVQSTQIFCVVCEEQIHICACSSQFSLFAYADSTMLIMAWFWLSSKNPDFVACERRIHRQVWATAKLCQRLHNTISGNFILVLVFKKGR